MVTAVQPYTVLSIFHPFHFVVVRGLYVSEVTSTELFIVLIHLTNHPHAQQTRLAKSILFFFFLIRPEKIFYGVL